MADGTLKFDTKVDDSGYVEGVQKMSSKQIKLTNDIKRTQAEMNKLEKSMKAMRSTKVPTQEYREIQNQISQAEAQLNKYLATEERLKATGGANTNSQSWKNLQYNIQQARNTLNAAKADMASLKSSGGDFTVGTDTSKLDAMQTKYTSLNGKLTEYNVKLEEVRAKENEASTSASRLSAMLQRLQSVCSIAANGLMKVGTVARTVGGAFLSITRGVVKATGSVLRGAKRMLSAMNPLSKISSMFRSMWGRMIIMSIGFMALTKALQAIGKGFSNIVRTSPQLTTSLAQIKGSLYTAFQPILDACLPALNALFSSLVKVTAAIAQFTSMLFGKSLKSSQTAAKSQYDQAKALDKTASSANKAKKALKGLSDIDELHNLSSEDKSSSGDSDNTIKPDFTTSIEESSGVSEFTELLKKSWREADFTEVGMIIGEKLNSAMEAISWDKIQTTSNNMAKSIATFLNGSIYGIDWTLAGSTLGNGIDTAIYYAQTFVNTFDWGAFGTVIGTGIESALLSIDWIALSLTISTGVNGIFSSIRNFAETVDFAGIGTSIGASLQGVFANIDWANIGITIGVGINSITSFLNNMSSQIDFIGIGNSIASSLDNMITSIDWAELGTTIANSFNLVIQSLYGFITSFDWTTFGTSLGDCINTALIQTDWIKLASGAGALVKGLIDAIDGFIRKIDWKALGITIGEMIKSIDWIGIAGSTIKLLTNAIKGLFNLIVGLGSSLGGWLWSGIKTGLAAIGSWFGTLFSGAWTNIKNAFSTAGTFFGGVRDGIKKSFSGIADWFKTTFSKAWTNVKNVFSTGGKIFDGIKEGILSGLKTVINGLINGINKVISIPFDGLNSALRKVKNISILGAKPFSFISEISVPKIPALATGTVVPANYGNFLATLGDNKKAPEVVSPVPTMKQAFKEALMEMGGNNGNSPIHLEIKIGNRTIMNEVIEANSENAKAGKISFAIS